MRRSERLTNSCITEVCKVFSQSLNSAANSIDMLFKSFTNFLCVISLNFEVRMEDIAVE